MTSPENLSFVGTEWLKLELAIEIIGDMIALNSHRLHMAMAANEEATVISSIENEIVRLVKKGRNATSTMPMRSISLKLLKSMVLN